MRSALLAGENGPVDLAGDQAVGGHQHRAARAIQALVRGGHDHMRNADRRRHHARCHQPADVRDVGQQIRADFIGDLAEFLPVRHPRIGRVTGNDHLGLMLLRQRADLVIVELLGFFIDRIMHGVELLTAAVDREPCERCPPKSRFIPSTVSPRFISAW